MEVKRLYGDALDKLLIFPGGRHTFANFQPVLMKVYCHAGLKEIAQNTEFRVETLKNVWFSQEPTISCFRLGKQYIIGLLAAFCESKTDQSSMPDLQQVTIDATADPLLILNISKMVPKGQENVNWGIPSLEGMWVEFQQSTIHGSCGNNLCSKTAIHAQYFT